MAKNVEQKFSIDLSGVVENSIAVIRAVRKSNQARKEAEFQRAIANGLSYEEQIKMREKQLEDEKESSVGDAEYIVSLEKSVADTKKLSRFNKYRTRYAETLGELSAGKINEEQYLSILQNQIGGVDDPELRLEIQGDITAARAKVKTYKDTILSNQVKKAKYDGTKASLNEAIARVNVARAEALINDNADEVTAYDETLSALNSQLSGVRIQDSITDFQVNSATRGTNPVEKLNYINSEIQNADPNIPIRINDRTYSSAQQFWSLERDNFLAGESKIFGNFFDEFKTKMQDYIGTEASKFGYPTQTVLDSSLATFNELRAKPEMTPFLGKLDITQADVISKSVDSLAKNIIAIATNNLAFKDADIQIQNIQTRYGVDMQGYRMKLDEQLRNISEDVVSREEKKKLDPGIEVALPKVETPTAPGVIPSVAPGGTRIVSAGDSLGKIATEAGVPLAKLLELNPQFQQNPDLIKVGQTVNLPGTPSPAAPAETPTPEKPTAAPKPVATPSAPAGTTPPMVVNLPEPKPTVKPPVTPTTPPGYTGVSIVDYLKSINKDSSFASRAKLAAEKGITNYRSEAKQNDELLKLLRG